MLTNTCHLRNLLAVNEDVMVVLRDTKDQKEYINKNGIHVIVGQYTGASVGAWDGSPNLTKGP